MKEIGGYFELELPQGKGELHQSAIKLNNARNALSVILQQKEIKRVFLPYYTCDVVLEPIVLANKYFCFYSIDKDFRPIFQYEDLNSTDLFLYVNYFGINQRNVEELINIQKKQDFHLAIDNSQAFYSKIACEKKVYAFNSARKFFGVPDGAYLYGLDKSIDLNLEQHFSSEFVEHLLLRIEFGASYGYLKSRENDSLHSHFSPAYMSKFTERILGTIDYEYVNRTRRNNFEYLNENIGFLNELDLDLEQEEVPLIYPLLLNHGESMRSFLIERNIFVAKYWPNKNIKLQQNSYENHLTNNLVAIPIDQRYGLAEMEHILMILRSFENEKI